MNDLFCVDCFQDDERSISAMFVINGDSVCGDHGRIAIAVRKEQALAREQVHGAGGRVVKGRG